MVGEDDDSFLEEEATGKEESFEEEMDNDEITPEEEGFLQGYDSADKEEERQREEKEEGEE